MNKIENEQELAIWLDQQLIDYKNHTGMMVYKHIRTKFKKFLKDPRYSKYFENDDVL